MTEDSYIQKLFRREVEMSKSLGIDEAVRSTAEELLRYVDLEQTKLTAIELRNKTGIRKRSDLMAVFKVLRKAVSKNGREILKEFDKNTVVAGMSRIVLKTPRSGCPMVEACKGDLELCEKLCRKHEEHDILTNPEFILLTKEINPSIKWRINQFRKRVDEPCEYAIVLE